MIFEMPLRCHYYYASDAMLLIDADATSCIERRLITCRCLRACRIRHLLSFAAMYHTQLLLFAAMMPPAAAMFQRI